MTLYSVRTTIGQENTTSKMLDEKLKKENEEIYSITVVDRLKGYIFVEGSDQHEVEKLIRGIKHAKGTIRGEVELDEVKPFIEEKTLTSEIKSGDIVELTSGAFKGEKAKVKRIDEGKEKITVEIIEAEVPIPVTVDASEARVLPSEKDKYK